MNVAETRTHYRLNKNQLHLLLLIYKFRFVTIPLLSRYNTQTISVLQRTLNVLLDQQYVARKFDRSYKIDRQPAIYYLTNKSIALFKGDTRCNDRVLHAFYKNKSVTDAFIQHVVATLEVYTLLKQAYGDRFSMFTRQEIAHLDDLPATVPDLYLRAETSYFVLLVHDLPPFLIRKRLTEYLTYLDERDPESGPCPTPLFIVADARAQRRLLALANTSLENAGIGDDELRIGIATIEALRLEPQSTASWVFTGDSSTPRQLAG